MVKYKLIIEYYQKGNNNSQIATLCGCSRTVVWEVLNRFNKIETIFADIQRMSEEELRILLFPERVKKDKGYLIPLNGKSFRCVSISRLYGFAGVDIANERQSKT